MSSDDAKDIQISTDLFEGEQHVISQLRKLRALTSERPSFVQPYIIVNIASCLEWYARAKVKQLIDFYPQQINVSAQILKETRPDYARLLRIDQIKFSLGDLVALANNFSSIEKINRLFDELLIREKKLDLHVRKKVEELKFGKKHLDRQLSKLFEMRNEIIHGSPSNFAYDEESLLNIDRREVESFITCALAYISLKERFLYFRLPGYKDRSTAAMRRTEWESSLTVERRLERLEMSVMRNLDDPEYQRAFQKAQRSWNVWIRRESDFQTFHYRHGTMHSLGWSGEYNSLRLNRIRQLEYFLREMSEVSS